MSDPIPLHSADIDPSVSPLQTLAQKLGAGGVPAATTQRELARSLGFVLLDTLKSDPRYLQELALPGIDAQPHPLHVWLGRMLDATWPDQWDAAHEARFNALASALLAVKDPNIQHPCIKFLTRLGHLHQLAGLLARDNLLQQTTGPSTARAFLDGDLGSKRGKNYDSPEAAVAALNRPSFELTFTAHPTNTSSIASMQDLREMGELLARWKKDDGRDPKLLPPQIRRVVQSYGDTPILPMDGEKPRTMSVREEVDHMLYYLGNTYVDLRNVYASYDKALTEKFADRYHPETLKLGVKFHSWGSSGDKDGNKKVNADTTLYALAAHYAEILERYRKDVRPVPGMYDWQEKIESACATAKTVQHEVRELLDGGEHLTETKFDQLSKKLKLAVAPLDARAFEADLDAAYAASDEKQKPATLQLLRNVHTFGFSFGSIEFRETAEEYQRLAESLIDGYATMDEPARQQALNALLQDPSKVAALITTFKTLGHGAEGKPYSDDDIAPIAYQTRKRMELARDFPGAIQNQVLAECQHTSHMLEALLLQHAVTDEHGTRPKLGIVPLFEDGDRLKAAPAIVKAALDTPIYHQHITDVATAQQIPAAQQIQLAHSDNARRNGMPAARGLIYKAHEDLRAMMQGYGDIALQFYEGGSQSDPYRGGARALSATVNEFGIHDFTKMTFQGGDLLNFLNQPMSFFRLFTRNLTNSAAKLEQPEHLRRKPDALQERKVVGALDAAKASYVDLFESDILNDFMETVGYSDEVVAGNTSSRAGARTANTKVDVKKTRSIGYSTVFQHIGISPTWLGTLDLQKTLLKNFGGRASTPGMLHDLYLSSPPLRDTIDRAMDGLALSDLDYAEKVSKHHALMPRFREEYAAAFDLCYKAYTGQKPPELATAAEMRTAIKQVVFPHMQEVFEDQEHFLTLARGIKRAWLPDNNGTSDRLLEHRLLHNALNTVYHGRRPLIDDTTYAQLYCDEKNIDRPYAPKNGHSSALDR